MQYPDSQLVKIGDVVELDADNRWVIVCDIDGDEYSEEYPKELWEYLKKKSNVGIAVLWLFNIYGRGG